MNNIDIMARHVPPYKKFAKAFMPHSKTKSEKKAERKAEREQERLAKEEAQAEREKVWLDSCSLKCNRDYPFYEKISVRESDLLKNFNNLNRTKKYECNAWNEVRTSRDMFMVKEVQALWDSTVELFHRLEWMKEEAISHGAARYNPTTGDFEWVKAKGSKEVIDKPKAS